MKLKVIWTSGWLAGVAALAGCAALDMPEADEGAKLFRQNCVACHGEAGKGVADGSSDIAEGALRLDRLSKDNGGVFPTSHVISVIDGYSRAKYGNPVMPEFGAEMTGPSVPVKLEDGSTSPVPRPLAGLVAYLESIQG